MLSDRRDSNPRPQPWEGYALPAELLSHCQPKLATRNEDIVKNNWLTWTLLSIAPRGGLEPPTHSLYQLSYLGMRPPSRHGEVSRKQMSYYEYMNLTRITPRAGE